MGAVNVNGASEEKRRRYWSVLRILRGESVQMSCIGDEVVSCASHYVGRSLLCAGPGRCRLCEAGCAIRSYTWAAVAVGSSIYLLRLPMSERILRMLGQGRSIEVRRSRQGHYTVQRLIDAVPEDGMPTRVPGRVLLEQLMRLHGVEVSGGSAMSSRDLIDAAEADVVAMCNQVATEIRAGALGSRANRE